MKCFICTELCGYYLESQKTKASPHSLRKSQCNSGKKTKSMLLNILENKSKSERSIYHLSTSKSADKSGQCSKVTSSKSTNEARRMN